LNNFIGGIPPTLGHLSNLFMLDLQQISCQVKSQLIIASHLFEFGMNRNPTTQQIRDACDFVPYKSHILGLILGLKIYAEDIPIEGKGSCLNK
jgi:hypothetical protein